MFIDSNKSARSSLVPLSTILTVMSIFSIIFLNCGSRSSNSFAPLVASYIIGLLSVPPTSYSPKNKGKSPLKIPKKKSVIHLVLLLPSMVIYL